MLANVLAGFAGILDSTRITTIVPLQGGPDLMFLAVAGAVIGGTSLFGGVGTVIGGFIGVAVLIILRTGFNIIGVSAFTFDLIIGLAIIAVDDRRTSRSRACATWGGSNERQRRRADAISVEHVSKSFGAVTALVDVSLHLGEGRGARADRRQRRRQVDADQDPERLPCVRTPGRSSSTARR